jgi:hypothetical protein
MSLFVILAIPHQILIWAEQFLSSFPSQSFGYICPAQCKQSQSETTFECNGEVTQKVQVQKKKNKKRDSLE